MLLMSQQGFEADRLDDYRGLYSRDPLLALVMMAMMFSTAGVPPFVGFWAKLSILQQLWVTGHIWLVIIAAVVSVIGAFYYLRIVKLMYFDPPGGRSAAAGVAAWRAPGGGGQWRCAVFVLGILPGPLLALCARAVELMKAVN